MAAAQILPVVQTVEQAKKSSRNILHVRRVTKSLNQCPSWQVDKHTAGQQVLGLAPNTMVVRRQHELASGPCHVPADQLCHTLLHQHLLSW